MADNHTTPGHDAVHNRHIWPHKTKPADQHATPPVLGDRVTGAAGRLSRSVAVLGLRPWCTWPPGWDLCSCGGSGWRGRRELASPAVPDPRCPPGPGDHRWNETAVL